MVTRTGTLIEGRLRANEMEGGGYHVERQTFRERGSQVYPTIDGYKHVVLGLKIFPPDFSERSE
jgi:hypothetical protein